MWDRMYLMQRDVTGYSWYDQIGVKIQSLIYDGFAVVNRVTRRLKRNVFNYLSKHQTSIVDAGISFYTGYRFPDRVLNEYWYLNHQSVLLWTQATADLWLVTLRETFL